MMEGPGRRPRKASCLKRELRPRIASRNGADGQNTGAHGMQHCRTPRAWCATCKSASHSRAPREISRIADMNPPRVQAEEPQPIPHARRPRPFSRAFPSGADGAAGTGTPLSERR